MTSIHHPKRLKEGLPDTTPENMIQILCLPTTNTTKRPNQQRHLPHKSIHPVSMTMKNLSSKEPHLLKDLNPPKHCKNQKPTHL